MDSRRPDDDQGGRMILEQYVKQQTAEYARMGLIDAKEGV